MPLVYLPDVESLFLWGSDPAPRALPTLGQGGESLSTLLLAPEGLQETAGLKLPLFDTMATLAIVPAAEIEGLPASVATWVLASKLALDLVARERVVPTITRRGGSHRGPGGGTRLRVRLQTPGFPLRRGGRVSPDAVLLLLDSVIAKHRLREVIGRE